MRIAILTGGGDVPGLNACIKALVTDADELGWEVLGFRRGWAGPLHHDPAEPLEDGAFIERLTPEKVRRIDRSGGTYLHSSRTHPGKVKPEDLPAYLAGQDFPAAADGRLDCTRQVVENLSRLGIDQLIAIGGDDTLSYAAHLHGQGIAVMAIPKTMDNDVFGTEYCIGFSTAVSRSVDMIGALSTPAGSHERIAVIELFGRDSGETALISGYLCDADRIVIPEVPVDLEKLADLAAKDRARNPSNYAIIVVSEGTRLTGDAVLQAGEVDAYGHAKLGGVGHLLAQNIKRRTGIDTLDQRLAYLMRAGPPDALDRMVATSFGHQAIQLISQGVSGRMLAVQDGLYATVPVETCISGVKRVDVDGFYDAERYRANIRTLTGKPIFLY